MSPGAGTRVVGYCRCSTKDQAENGVSLEQQRQAILEAAERRGWTVIAILEEQVSGAARSRPVRDAAIGMIESGAADVLVAAKLDRLTRSIVDFGYLLERRVPLVVLDADLDMTSPIGEMVANVLMTFAQFERRLIGQRTRDALATKKSEGVQLGRPRQVPEAIVARIRRDRDAGLSLPQIAARLNEDAIPTVSGGAKWWHSTVRAILEQESRGTG